MATTREQRRRAYLAKATEEFEGLEARGIVMSGNAFSPVLLLKGEPSPEELSGAEPLSGGDGDALRAALARLGYAPEDWAALLGVTRSGEPVGAALLREAVTCLDPVTLVALDQAAADLVRAAWAAELSALPSFDEAMLTDGLVVRLLGMRVLSLGGFAAALDDPEEKQVMWARLKRIPPLGEPY